MTDLPHRLLPLRAKRRPSPKNAIPSLHPASVRFAPCSARLLTKIGPGTSYTLDQADLAAIKRDVGLRIDPEGREPSEQYLIHCVFELFEDFICGSHGTHLLRASALLMLRRG
jgi:hypothetical protein